jgi:isocitrate/isopropylmalate dehydrogenase
LRTHRVAAIPGDGLGWEVIAAGYEVLAACVSATTAFGPTSRGSIGARRTIGATA